MPFDFVNADPHDMRELSSQYASAAPMPGSDLYAAMGQFTLRGLAAGQYQIISVNIFIQFEQAAAVVLDTFNFEGDAFWRVWYCAAAGGVPLYNSSFRSFSERHAFFPRRQHHYRSGHGQGFRQRHGRCQGKFALMGRALDLDRNVDALVVRPIRPSARLCDEDTDLWRGRWHCDAYMMGLTSPMMILTC
ncbi:MAG: hypothetical protein J5855_06725 [Mailhella sp.]|nr:hypothetical protein [Mailhella sp.]